MQESENIVREMSSALGSRILQAYELAKRVHHGEKRKSGEPYITHPVQVAKVLFDAGADEAMICGALLHDTLEGQAEPEVISNEIYSVFGDEVLYLVQVVSKDATIEDKIDQQEAYIAQIERSFKIDIFAFFIKIADLIHNMHTIQSLPKERRDRWIHELRYQYLPLFSTHIHKIPLVHRELFLSLIDRIESLASSYDALP